MICSDQFKKVRNFVQVTDTVRRWLSFGIFRFRQAVRPSSFVCSWYSTANVDCDEQDLMELYRGEKENSPSSCPCPKSFIHCYLRALFCCCYCCLAKHCSQSSVGVKDVCVQYIPVAGFRTFKKLHTAHNIKTSSSRANYQRKKPKKKRKT